MQQEHCDDLAYVIGATLGDGNLSRPNKRATRLRITCDSRYPNIAREIVSSLSILFPHNKVSFVQGPKITYFNISVYSNKLDGYMPWKVGGGSKIEQSATVPLWILAKKQYIRACLRGLIHTDGSIYYDRGYVMVNFCTNIPDLAKNAKEMMEILGYRPRLYKTAQKSGHLKYSVRLSREVNKFLKEMRLQKH